MLQGRSSSELLPCAISQAVPAPTPNAGLERPLLGERIQMRKGSKVLLHPPEMPHLDVQVKSRHRVPWGTLPPATHA